MLKMWDTRVDIWATLPVFKVKGEELGCSVVSVVFDLKNYIIC